MFSSCQQKLSTWKNSQEHVDCNKVRKLIIILITGSVNKSQVERVKNRLIVFPVTVWVKL